LAIGGTSSTKPTLIPANQPLLSQIKYSDPEVIQYAKRVFGTTNLTDAQWKQCTDQLKVKYSRSLLLSLPISPFLFYPILA